MFTTIGMSKDWPVDRSKSKIGDSPDACEALLLDWGLQAARHFANRLVWHDAVALAVAPDANFHGHVEVKRFERASVTPSEQDIGAPFRAREMRRVDARYRTAYGDALPDQIADSREHAIMD